MRDATETGNKRHSIEEALWEAAEKWDGDFFDRKGLVAFSGNSFSEAYLANLDSKGEGPEDSFYIGRKRMYKKVAGVKWLIGRIKMLHDK